MTITHTTLTINSKQYDILYLCYKFQRDIDAKGRPWGVYYGGSILVQVESTNDISSFQQMIDKKTTPVAGSIEVFSGDGTCMRRIDFEKAYVVSLSEEMYGKSSSPMITTIGISPMRLDFNNTLRLDRRWPGAPHGWQKYEPKKEKWAAASHTEEETEVAEIEVVTTLTKNEFSSRAGMELGKSYKLRVKSYTDGAPRNPDSIRWEYSYQTNKEDGEVVVGAIIDQRGEEIEFTVKDDGAVGSSISFYAYISKQKKEGELNVYVTPLWRYKGTKEWGKIGTGTESKSQRLSLERMKALGMLNNTGYLRAEYLSHLSEQAVRNIYEGNNNIAGVRQVLSGDDNLQQRVLNSFYTGSEPKMSFGPASMLSQKLKINPTFQEYYKRYLGVIKGVLDNKNLNIATMTGDAMARQFGPQEIYLQLSKPNFSKVREIIKYDYYGLMGGTQKIKVDLDIIKTKEGTYIVKTRMYIGDWYGADEGDINGLTSLKGNVGSLNAFFWLQHHYGYHPFETEIIYESIDRIEL